VLVALLGLSQRTTEVGGEGLIKQTHRISERGWGRTNGRWRGVARRRAAKT
jgi:hypothetical protein